MKNWNARAAFGGGMATVNNGRRVDGERLLDDVVKAGPPVGRDEEYEFYGN